MSVTGKSSDIGDNIRKAFAENIVPDKIIVVYDKRAIESPANKQMLEKLNFQFGFKSLARLKAFRKVVIDVVKLPKSMEIKSYKDFLRVKEIYKHLPFVKNVYPDVKYKPAAVAIKFLNGTVVNLESMPLMSTSSSQPAPASLNINDGYAHDLWNLEFIGIEKAWSYTTGSPDVVVAVIDTGIVLHPDLVGNIWVNRGEIPGNNIDDDGNGYVDDFYGYDFADHDPYPWDTDGHGTHVAGIIAAEANNSIGVAGVAPHVKVMALKASCDYCRFLDGDAILAAIDYVITMKERGVNIVAVSASWGSAWIGLPPDIVLKYFEQPLYDAIKELGKHGILFVVAAGNYGTFIDDAAVTITPAEYNLPNVISVGSVNSDGYLSWFSNYGYGSVDLLAPGDWILSTYGYTCCGGRTRTDYTWMSGTSMATPHVSGVAALLASYFKNHGIKPSNLSIAIKLALLLTANQSYHDENAMKWVKAGYLNASTALETVVTNPSKVGAILISPTPLPYPGASQNPDDSMRADLVPAGVNVTFKVLAGTVTGSLDNTVVKVIDHATGRVIGVLRDDGTYPDEAAGDAVYTGNVVIPINTSLLGLAQERNITIAVYDSADNMLYARTYTLKVMNIGATYEAKPTQFTWVNWEDLNTNPIYYFDIMNGVFTPVHSIMIYKAITNIFGINWTQMTQWQYGRELRDMIPPLGKVYKQPSIIIGSLAVGRMWSQWIGSPPLFYGPENIHGIFAEIVAVAVPDPDTHIHTYKLQVIPTTIDGVNAKAYIMHEFGCSYGAECRGTDLEIIALDNGSIIMSYDRLNTTVFKASPIAFISLGGILSTVYNISTLADSDGVIRQKSIIFNPVPLVQQPTPQPTYNMEWGVVSVTHVPKFVSFQKTYTNPVVVAGPATYNGPDPVIPSILSINNTGFTIALKEWDYLDGKHTSEDVGYIVVEAGTHHLSDGRQIEAGYANASTTGWRWVQFPESFDATPIVVASIASDTPHTVTVRIKGVNTTGFFVMLEPQESLKDSVSLSAKVSWIAVEPGATDVLEAGTVALPEGNNPSATINFANTYTKKPIVLASIETFKGADPVILRIKSLTTASATLMMQEETSKDSETYHVSETVAYIILSPS
ncbi:hypothetical protein PYJP_17040 [Pyrofollis japonicus]|nr:hypothetical protein PYJP_17040 [Pyrofollis japonicus]